MKILVQDGWPRNSRVWSDAENTLMNNLYPTLFVGESNFSIYAMPALVDAHTITIVPKAPGPPLIEGAAPIKVEVDLRAASIISSSRPVAQFDINTAKLTHETVEGEFLLLGYHQPPETVQSELISKWIHFGQQRSFIDFVEKMDNKNAELIRLGDEQSKSFVLFPFRTTKALSLFLLAVIVSTFCIVAGCIYVLQKNGQGSILSRSAYCKSSQTSKISNFPLWTSNTSAEVPDGWVLVGKISYNPDDRLGVGCEGTVVYRGMFDGRQVAVKRVISDFQLAVREVDHLKESDANSNVIRYFCMESDANFHYIALELCEYSLVDYVENSEAREFCSLSEIDILLQATKGVAHLHSINIVHRDIKPQNVLLSRGQNSGRARALISDFGFCKRLQSGQYSVSHQSGVVGSDGWMAPEAINDSQHMTCAVDVFSLGCVYFYVLTEGMHPFGNAIKRQSNILQNEYNFAPLFETKNLVSAALIESMLKSDPELRPSSSDLISHPFFWTKLRELQFFSDVSDRIEKEEEESCVLIRLEENAYSVIGSNWRNLICGALAEDLRKFRTYRGQSIRDLLRAMRNKKHHYRELPTIVQNSLGRIPDQFITYFTDRFPNLLMHTYNAMACCANEPIFMGYYSESAQHAAQFLTVAHKISDIDATFSSSSEENLINSSQILEANNEDIVHDDHIKKKRKRRRKKITKQSILTRCD